MRVNPRLTLFVTGIESIPDPGLGEDVTRRGRIRFNLLSQVTDKHTQVLILFDVIPAPDRSEQRAMCQDLAGVLNKIDEQFKFFRRQMNGATAHRYLARLEIDMKVARVEHPRRSFSYRRSIRATQRRPQPRS